MADNGPNRIFVGGGARVPGLVQTLEGILGARVTDRTGIPGTSGFNYALEFVLDGRTRRNPFGAIAGAPLQIAADPSSVQPAPNLFTALERQLGLRLEPRRYRATTSSSTRSSGELNSRNSQCPTSNSQKATFWALGIGSWEFSR